MVKSPGKLEQFKRRNQTEIVRSTSQHCHIASSCVPLSTLSVMVVIVRSTINTVSHGGHRAFHYQHCQSWWSSCVPLSTLSVMVVIVRSTINTVSHGGHRAFHYQHCQSWWSSCVPLSTLSVMVVIVRSTINTVRLSHSERLESCSHGRLKSAFWSSARLCETFINFPVLSFGYDSQS